MESFWRGGGEWGWGKKLGDKELKEEGWEKVVGEVMVG